MKDTEHTQSSTAAGGANAGEALPKGYTPKKGRPTPKRKDAQVARTTTVRHGETRAEARARRKAEKASMTREEWKAKKRAEREERARRAKETQAAMDRGDERYLLERDKGEVRRFVRDWVDSRRFISNSLMPIALVLLLVMFIGQRYPEAAAFVSYGAMFVMVAFFAEAFIIGRRANKAVRAKFPNTTDTGFNLGFYAYSRANQPRRLRTPKPQVNIGDKVG